MNSHYYRARAKWAKKELDWVNDDVRLLLVSTGYTPDFAAHEFLSSIVAGNRLGTAVALAGKAVVAADGRCTATSPVTISDPGSSGTAKGIALYKHTGSDATAPLLIWMDEAISGLPVAMTGTPVQITLPAAGLFVL